MALKIGLSIAAAGLLFYAFERDAVLHMLVLIGFLLFLVTVAKALASQTRKNHRRRRR